MIPNKDQIVRVIAHQLGGLAVTLPALAAIWTGAAYFGVNLPRPAWQDDIASMSCNIARIDLELYPNKLRRETRRLEILVREADSIPTDDRLTFWRNVGDRADLEDKIAEFKGYIETAREKWNNCRSGGP